MTMINTANPGTTVEVTTTVNYGPQRPAQVRLQSWAERGDPALNIGCDRLCDLRLTVEQALQLADALQDGLLAVRVANANAARPPHPNMPGTVEALGDTMR